jgi:hypothetical protein
MSIVEPTYMVVHRMAPVDVKLTDEQTKRIATDACAIDTADMSKGEAAYQKAVEMYRLKKNLA